MEKQIIKKTGRGEEEASGVGITERPTTGADNTTCLCSPFVALERESRPEFSVLYIIKCLNKANFWIE